MLFKYQMKGISSARLHIEIKKRFNPWIKLSIEFWDIKTNARITIDANDSMHSSNRCVASVYRPYSTYNRNSDARFDSSPVIPHAFALLPSCHNIVRWSVVQYTKKSTNSRETAEKIIHQDLARINSYQSRKMAKRKYETQ